MNKVEELITAVLHGRADREVDGTTLVRSAVTRGRKYRRRRKAQRYTGAVALSVATVAAVAALPHVLRDVGGDAHFAASAMTLPDALDEPTALVAPDRVGRDPGIVHFDAPEVLSDARLYTWTSGEGYERLSVVVDETQFVDITIGTNGDVLAAVPREGMAPSTVREQPVDGLWLEVRASGESLARQALDTVRLDRAQRIALPFQLSTLPDTAIPVTAYVGFSSGKYVHGGVVLRSENGNTMEVQAEYLDVPAGRRSANHTVAGRPAYLYPSQDELEILDFPDLYLSARLGKAYSGFTIEEAETVLAGVSVAPEVHEMTTWPSSLTFA